MHWQDKIANQKQKKKTISNETLATTIKIHPHKASLQKYNISLQCYTLLVKTPYHEVSLENPMTFRKSNFNDFPHRQTYAWSLSMSIKYPGAQYLIIYYSSATDIFLEIYLGNLNSTITQNFC